MRTRDLKPDFWTDERIVQLSDAAKLLFQGLWCMADREGKLEDQPLTIGFKVRPWDPKPVEKLLNELAESGVIIRYVAEGRRYIVVPTFQEHQRFHPNEKARGLPSVRTEVVPEDHLGTPRGAPKSEQHTSSNAEPSEPSEPSEPAGSSVPSLAQQAPDAQALADAWNEITKPPLPKIQELGKARKAQARAALERRPLEEWRSIFERINRSPLCRGEVGSGWVADFDWATRPEGKKPEPALKVLEGAFDRTSQPRSIGPPGRAPVRAEDMPTPMTTGDVSAVF